MKDTTYIDVEPVEGNEVRNQKKKRSPWFWVSMILIILMLCCITTVVGGTVFKAINKGNARTTPEPCANCKTPEIPVADTDTGSYDHGNEVVCKYADGFNAEGRTVRKGTIVTGPAVVKPDRNINWAIPIYLGETYMTDASDEVIWILIGDNACVDAQAQYFNFWGPTHP